MTLEELGNQYAEELKTVEAQLKRAKKALKNAKTDEERFSLNYKIYIGIHWSDTFKGCNLERQVAFDYGIKVHVVDHCLFFPDVAEIERKNRNYVEGTCVRGELQ